MAYPEKPAVPKSEVQLWNPVISFYIKRLLQLLQETYNGTTIDPLRDLTVKPEIKYNF